MWRGKLGPRGRRGGAPPVPWGSGGGGAAALRPRALPGLSPARPRPAAPPPGGSWCGGSGGGGVPSALFPLDGREGVVRLTVAGARGAGGGGGVGGGAGSGSERGGGGGAGARGGRGAAHAARQGHQGPPARDSASRPPEETALATAGEGRAGLGGGTEAGVQRRGSGGLGRSAAVPDSLACTALHPKHGGASDQHMKTGRDGAGRGWNILSGGGASAHSSGGASRALAAAFQ